MGSPLASLTRDILGNEETRGSATYAIKEKVDWIFGHSKYDAEEIRSELPDRLHCMEYLGIAVRAILKSEAVPDGAKESIAGNYLRVLPLYIEGSLPKDVYDRWEGMEPTCAVEAAVFLNERGLLDWDDRKLLTCVLQFASGSGVKVKKDFLSALVARLNRDAGLLDDLARVLWMDDLARELRELSGKNRDPFGLDGLPEEKESAAGEF